MSSLVLDIDDWPVADGAPAIINRTARYFLLMTGSDVNVTWYSKGTAIGHAVGLQGGDGIGPLSSDYDKVVLESATSQTCKVATTSDPVTITRLSGVVQVSGVVTTTSIPDDTWPEFSALRTATSSAGSFAVAIYRNPAGSGKDMFIQKVGVAPQGAGNHYVSQVDSVPEVLDSEMAQNASPHDYEAGETSELLMYFAANGISSAANSFYTWNNGSGIRKVDFSGNSEFDLKRPVKLSPGRDLVVYSSTENVQVGTFIEYEERER